MSAREAAEAVLPPKREEEAIAGAVLQRLMVQRDALGDAEARARQVIETLQGRIAQLARDMEREARLNRDAGETIARLDWELAQLLKAHEGHDDKLAEAVEVAREAGAILTEREAQLSKTHRGCGAAGGAAPIGAALAGGIAGDAGPGRGVRPGGRAAVEAASDAQDMAAEAQEARHRASVAAEETLASARRRGRRRNCARPRRGRRSRRPRPMRCAPRCRP